MQQIDTQAGALLTRDEMEMRRLLAAEDLQSGFSQSHVARKFGVSRTSASRWHRELSQNGVEALHRRAVPGRPSRLSAEQSAEVVGIYQAGALAAGFADDRWTTARLAEAIYARFKIHYAPDHVGRIMHRLGLRTKRERRSNLARIA